METKKIETINQIRKRLLSETRKRLNLKNFLCTKCGCIHYKKDNIYSTHFKFRDNDSELSKHQIYIFKLKRNWKNTKNHKL